MFRVKICGITNEVDARAAADAGADAIGLNFFAKSPRYVQRDPALRIVESLPPTTIPVGVFVNEHPAVIRRLALDLRLKMVQLHGDELPDQIAELAGIPVLKGFRASDDVCARALTFTQDCRERQTPLAGILLDAAKPGMFGGTGTVVDWSVACQLRASLGDVSLILAGGLNAGNVADAVQAVRPFGVDTASGVEASPGQKDHQQITAFVRAAKEVLGL